MKMNVALESSVPYTVWEDNYCKTGSL